MNGFAVKLDPDGGHVWSRGFLAAPWIYESNVVQDIAADALGNAYVTIRGGSDQSSVSGTFTGPFDLGTGPIPVSGPSDAFVSTLSP